MKDDCNQKTGKALSPRTVHHYHEFLSSALTRAYKEGLISTKIADRASPPKFSTKDPTTLEPEEMDTVIQIAGTLPIKWKAIVLLLCETGVRRGELLGLKWSSIDFTTHEIQIVNNVIQGKERGIYETTPKTKKSVRKIKISQRMCNVLKELQLWQSKERLRLGQYYDNRDYLFTQDNGKPMSPDSVTTYFDRDLSTKCGFHVYPHLLRHSQASFLAYNGVDPVSISNRLGHAHVSTTLDIYASAFRKADAEVANVVEGWLYKNA